MLLSGGLAIGGLDNRTEWPMTTRRDIKPEQGTAVLLSRRGALALAVAGAAVGLARPAIAQTTIEWKMATVWPKDLPGPGQSAQRICDAIELMSGGRMRVRLFSAGELAPPAGVFDAVSGGTAQMGHAASAFWQERMPAAVFFSAVPFGLLPQEQMTWIELGGGQGLWEKLYAPYGVQPFMAGNSGGQMGGWFTRPVERLEDLNGLKVRMPGLGGEVLRRLGATPVSLPAEELIPALRSGLLDAAEFLGPASDQAMGFQSVSKLYYAPGFQEPNGTYEALVNAVAFNGLPEDLREIVRAACRVETSRALSESNWLNAEALRQLTETDGVEVRQYPEDVLLALRSTSADVVSGLAATSDLAREIYNSYAQAQVHLAPWSAVTEGLMLRARAL